ncbi:MAG: hypothetical protein HC925_08615 [Coleofasciculaceae cyanobacterium SM2_3_26]|nr:hypothetical protein [Coleofasciculaceae cyanobacterium SM2_3_26]
MRPSFLLVDGHSLAYRSYYAHAKSYRGGLRTSTGIPTSATYGFLKALLQAIATHQPGYLAVAFDRDEPTFRHELDANYKSDRAEAPEDFFPDVENLRELLEAMGLQVVTYAGYEADDIIGTLTERAVAARVSPQGCRRFGSVKILSGDRDLFQLIHSETHGTGEALCQVTVLYPSTKDGMVEYDSDRVKEKLGVTPEQVVDYKALCGDASDKIPGVRGIGEKTAAKLLATYPSLDAIYDALAEIKGAVQKKLEVGRDEAYRSQHLARIVLDVPLDLDLEACKLQAFDFARLNPLLQKLEFNSFQADLDRIQQKLGGTNRESTEARAQT